MCLLCGTDWIFIYNSTFWPHSVFMYFVLIWDQTAIISLYSINWLVFITETECVYCAVRTGSLCIKFCVLPTQCIYVFCVDLRTNSDYLTTQKLRCRTILSNASQFLGQHCSLKFARLRRLSFLWEQNVDDNQHAVMVEWYWEGKTEVLYSINESAYYWD